MGQNLSPETSVINHKNTLRRKKIKTDLGLKYFLYFILYDDVAKQSNIYPITCHEGPNREWRYVSTLSLTSSLEDIGWLSATLRPLFPRE
jgi:hypothetical protein